MRKTQRTKTQDAFQKALNKKSIFYHMNSWECQNENVIPNENYFLYLCSIYLRLFLPPKLIFDTVYGTSLKFSTDAELVKVKL